MKPFFNTQPNSFRVVSFNVSQVNDEDHGNVIAVRIVFETKAKKHAALTLDYIGRKKTPTTVLSKLTSLIATPGARVRAFSMGDPSSLYDGIKIINNVDKKFDITIRPLPKKYRKNV